MRTLFAIALALAAPSCFAAQVDDRAAVAIAKPQELIVDKSLPPASVDALLTPVDAFYGFWNNGSAQLLSRALSPSFIDHTLPPGRPQARPAP